MTGIRKTILLIFIAMSLFNLKACRTIPSGAEAVTSFDSEKYLGLWYEIARMDFRFERNLKNTTAEYSLNTDGSIKVRNRGQNIMTDKWSEAVGKAKFVKKPDIAMLKVSFFGPFYDGYNVLAIDPDYKYALICGSNIGYLWLLSREKTMPEDIKQDYLKKARELGARTNELIWVAQD